MPAETVEQYLRRTLELRLTCRMWTERCDWPTCSIADCPKNDNPSAGSVRSEPTESHNTTNPARSET